uniref:Methyltransferase n=1 Tax=Ascaris lumbricoides TaxID=6252 RepID=A0A0M3IBA8_ASCLU
MTEIGFQIVHDEAMSEDPRIVEDYYETTDQHFEQRAASWCFEVQDSSKKYVHLSAGNTGFGLWISATKMFTTLYKICG